jgi:cobaltochelatase CobS
LPAAPATLSSSGKPIKITVLDVASMDEMDRAMIPRIDPNYVFNVDVLKTLILALEKNIPANVWGHAGTGKTTIIEQVCARTNRPMIRVQHTANMEEAHVLGQYVLRNKETSFQRGPLADAMQRGWLYLADEYDFGRPEVLSLYQPVLEGKPLIIKEADPANRITPPHPFFAFFATGNTNGTGDESGLYQGTMLQNAANYERFGITERMPYMEPDLEAKLVSSQADIPVPEARKLVDFAGRIRNEFDGGKISTPISPRTLIYAGRVGKARMNFRIGLEKSFINRLSTVDREVAGQFADRVFGAAK